jgi:hypothetical protein
VVAAGEDGVTAALLLAALLSVTDPSGDAIGGGDLRYPSHEVFRVPGTLDVQALTVHDTEGFSFSLKMAQLTDPWDLPFGFSLPIIELYLDARFEGGSPELLPGSGMHLPEGVRWHYAFRLTGESLELFYADPGGEVVEVGERYEAQVSLGDGAITVTSSLPTPRHFSLYGVVGGYDPWDPTRWRRVRPEAETFAFGSPYQAATDIRAVDVIAGTFEAQQAAIRSGVLPEIRPPERAGRWLGVIAAGLALAFVGSAGRVYVGVRDRARPRPSIGYGSEPVRVLEPIDLFAALPSLEKPLQAEPQEEAFRPVPPHLALVKREKG